MVVVCDGDRYVRDMRVVGDHIVSHTDQSTGIEGAEGTPGVGFSQLARELLQTGTRGEEAQVAVLSGRFLMQGQDRIGVLDPGGRNTTRRPSSRSTVAAPAVL